MFQLIIEKIGFQFILSSFFVFAKRKIRKVENDPISMRANAALKFFQFFFLSPFCLD